MSVLYIVVVFFVIVLLLSAPVYPFWKVCKRIRESHPGIWADQGPFTLVNMTSHPEVFKNLLTLIKTADTNPQFKGTDPELVRWSRTAHEIVKMAPKSFLAQVGYFVAFIYFVGFFTSIIFKVFGLS